MKQADAQLISSAHHIAYLTNLYFFSETEREAYLIITKNKKYLITDKRYSDEARIKAKGFRIIESGTLNFISGEIEEFLKKENIKILGIEEKNLTVFEYKKIKKVIYTKPLFLENLRSIKTHKEILQITKACNLTDLAFEYILKKIKVGISEKEIANELILFFRKNNADYSFPPIVAFGENSSIPHHEPSTVKLKKNQIVLLDFGVKINNYCSDMTRTIYFGKADKRFKEIYNLVLNAQKSAIEKIKSGSKASEIDNLARKVIKEKYEDFSHALGHGIGLEVHEAPTISSRSKELLKNGMIFSIEPGIYIPGYGGVRIEDIVLVRDGKAELISKAKRGLIELNA